MVFGGEAIFLATLQGTGKVWLQALPFSRLADRILANAPSRWRHLHRPRIRPRWSRKNVQRLTTV